MFELDEDCLEGRAGGLLDVDAEGRCAEYEVFAKADAAVIPAAPAASAAALGLDCLEGREELPCCCVSFVVDWYEVDW